MILVADTAGQCDTADPEELKKSPFAFICNLPNQAAYFVPIVLIIIFCIVCAVVAWLLRSALDEDDEDDENSKARNNYY